MLNKKKNINPDDEEEEETAPTRKGFTTNPTQSFL
jgi:hypothetical protein